MGLEVAVSPDPSPEEGMVGDMNEEKTYEQGFEDGKREVLRQIDALAHALMVSNANEDLEIGVAIADREAVTWLVHGDLPGHRSQGDLSRALRDAARVRAAMASEATVRLRAALGEP